MTTYNKPITNMTIDCNNKKGLFTYSIALYLLSIPLDFINLFGIGSITRFVAFVPLVISLLKQISIPFNNLTKSLLLFLFFNAVSIVFSPYRSEAAENFLAIFFNVFLILWLSQRKFNQKEISFLFKAVYYSSWIIVVFIFMFSSTGESGRISIKIEEFSQNMNYISGYLFLSQAYCLTKIFYEQKYKYFISYIAFMIVVFVTGARGGLVASVAILFTILFYINFKSSKGYKYKLKLFFGELFLLITAIIVFIYIVPDEIINRFTLSSIVESKGSNRLLIWDSMLNAFKQFPFENMLFGVGNGVSHHYSYNQVYAAHNVYIAYLLDIGIVGLISYIIVIINSFKIAVKNCNAIIISSLVGFYTMCITSTFTNFKPLWALLLLIIIYDVNVAKDPILISNSTVKDNL